MAPVQTLRWIAGGAGPSEENVEIDGSEPYIVGGHTASGYWVSTGRETTIGGLFAAGDVCGGAPQKYVTGALAEAAIAAEAIKERCKSRAAGQNKRESGEAGQSECESGAAGQNKSSGGQPVSESWEDWRAHTDDAQAAALLEGCHSCISGEDRAFSGTDPSADDSVFSTEELEAAMQKAMDEYAGGIKTNYSYNEAGLEIADRKIRRLQELQGELRARSMDELLRVYELRERLVTARALIAHMRARQETRWHSFQENSDHPEKKKEFELYVNSRMAHGEIQILYRPLAEREAYYEHTD